MGPFIIFMDYIKRQDFKESLQLQGEISMFGFHFKRSVCTIAAAVFMAGSCLAAGPADMYKQAVETMIAQPTGDYTMHLDLGTPIGKMTGVTVTQLKAEPFQLKSVTTVSALNRQGQDVTVYAEQVGNQLVTYTSVQKDGKTQWRKDIQKLDSSEPVVRSMQKQHNLLAGVKSVENDGQDRYKVVFDSSRLYTDNDKKDWTKKGMTKDQVNTIATVLKALQQAGDVSMIVAVDPASQRITHVEGNLTKQMQSIVTTGVDQVDVTASTKAMVKTLANSSTLQMSIDCKALAADADLSVPKDVKDKAVENSKKNKDNK
jgi:hypothetical protein